MRSLLRRLVPIGIKSSNKVKAVFFLHEDFADVTGIDEPEQSQEDLECAADHLNVLVVQQAASNSNDVVVFGGQVRVHYWGNQAARPILHPPRAVQRGVECHDKVPIL